MARLFSGFEFTEGPAPDHQGNLYFTDHRDGRGKIYKLDGRGNLTMFVEYSGRANGLMVNARGEIVACQMDGRVVAYSPTNPSGVSGSCKVLADSFQGRRFNAPNDLVIDSQGGIYFTDPLFGAPLPFLPQKIEGVYYLSPQGEVTRLIEDLKTPNGILLSPDEKTLYVVQSFKPEVMAYTVEGPGRLGPGRVFCCLVPSRMPIYSGGDGLTLDTQGNLYISSNRGVQIFNSEGKLLGILEIPESPANLAFGGPDMKTLFVTARTSLYAIPMSAAGHLFARPAMR